MYSRSKVRTSVTPKEVNPFGLQFSLQAQATTVNERPSLSKQSSDFRFGRDQQNSTQRSLSENTDVPLPRRRHSQPLTKDGDGQERQSSASHSASMEHRSAPRHRQVHHPATAYAAQLTDLTQPEVMAHHSQISKTQGEDSFNPYMQQTPRLVHSAGALHTRHHKGIMHIPGDKVVIAESPATPGVPVIYRSQEEKSANPDRLNLDRRRLTVCPVLDGEDHLRLLNFQHNSIRRIEHLTSLRRLIFLDLYDNQLEEIAGLGALKSLRVLMLGKNRIKKIENLNALTKLDVLDLHGNQIDRIENLCHLVELRVLNLAGNIITHVSGLAGMEALTELNLRRNEIITVSDADNLPSLQRLFLSFNCIRSYEDISCIADAHSLSEISLDGNPLSQDTNYKSIILKNVHQIRQLDMKKVTEEEKRMSSTVAKREEEKKREANKLMALKEKRRIAINNAAQQWEVSKSTGMAKTIYLHPGVHSVSKEEKFSSPDNMHRRLCNAIPPLIQLLTALHFYGTGAFYMVEGDLHDISTASVCRIVIRVTRAISRLTNDVISFPVHVQDVMRVKQEFFAVAGFPGVVGALDCTHVRLYGAPLGDDEPLCVNRKGYHSINVQAVCDAGFRITNVVARWPDSTHDSAVLHGSLLGQMFTDGSSSDMETDVNQAMDLLGDKSTELSCGNMHSDTRTFTKVSTPDLLSNISSAACHLAELDGDTLHLYGHGSMEALDKNWGIQAAGSLTTISFKFIDFDEITKHLYKIRIRFPNVSTLFFGECNLSSLQQLNALTSLRHLDNITIADEGNPVMAFSLWKPYLIFRLSHLNIKKINNEEVFLSDHKHAEDLFAPISHITTSLLPSFRLLELLGDKCRSNTQALSELELKGKKQIMADQKTVLENVGKAGLQFFCKEIWHDLLQERFVQLAVTCNYVKARVIEAIQINKKQTVLEKAWPRVFVQTIDDAVEKMFALDRYKMSELRNFHKRK